MTSVPRGNGAPDVAVAEIGPEGVHLVVGGRSFLLNDARFPWFRGALEADVRHVVLPAPHHLRWPELDVDIELDSVRHPDRYPRLMSRPKES